MIVVNRGSSSVRTANVLTPDENVTAATTVLTLPTNLTAMVMVIMAALITILDRSFSARTKLTIRSEKTSRTLTNFF